MACSCCAGWCSVPLGIQCWDHQGCFDPYSQPLSVPKPSEPVWAMVCGFAAMLAAFTDPDLDASAWSAGLVCCTVDTIAGDDTCTGGRFTIM